MNLADYWSANGQSNVEVMHGSHLAFVNNTITGANSVYGRAIHSWGGGVGSAVLENSIVINEGNTAPAKPLCQIGGTAGTVYFSDSNNLEGYLSTGIWTDTATCGSPGNFVPGGAPAALTDIVATALADNGGPTQTLALPSVGSPAYGAADTGGSSRMWDGSAWVDATRDQRGYARENPSAGKRSIGAHEYNGLGILTQTLSNGTAASSYGNQAIITDGGQPALTFAATGLPVGLSIDPGTGIISGTPTTPGSYTVAVTVTDSGNRIATRSYPVNITTYGGVSSLSLIPRLPVPLLLAASMALLGGRLLRTLHG